MVWKRIKQSLSKLKNKFFTIKNNIKRSLGKIRKSIGGTRKHPIQPKNYLENYRLTVPKNKSRKIPRRWKNSISQEYRNVYENRNAPYKKLPVTGKTAEQRHTMTEPYHRSMKYAPEPIPREQSITPLSKRLRNQYVQASDKILPIIRKDIPENVQNKISQYI